MSKDTGGSAFPGLSTDYKSYTNAYEFGMSYEGMTLRDYFAAKAMQSGIAIIGKVPPRNVFEEVAKTSYQFADAMIAERNK